VIRRLKPDILYMETSSNPLTVVPDIALLVQEAKRVNPNAISIIDNTYATPLFVKPLSLGVDLVLHSMTKYLNGHGDALAGIILSNSAGLMDRVRHTVIDFGTPLSPWDAWLVLRGMRTLGVRMQATGRGCCYYCYYYYYYYYYCYYYYYYCYYYYCYNYYYYCYNYYYYYY
jgi:methionine-gamma-lyase